jgi:hypothetical protein
MHVSGVTRVFLVDTWSSVPRSIVFVFLVDVCSSAYMRRFDCRFYLVYCIFTSLAFGV